MLWLIQRENRMTNFYIAAVPPAHIAVLDCLRICTFLLTPPPRRSHACVWDVSNKKLLSTRKKCEPSHRAHMFEAAHAVFTSNIEINIEYSINLHASIKDDRMIDTRARFSCDHINNKNHHHHQLQLNNGVSGSPYDFFISVHTHLILGNVTNTDDEQYKKKLQLSTWSPRFLIHC